jgi:hypothetical protein
VIGSLTPWQVRVVKDTVTRKPLNVSSGTSVEVQVC